MKEIWVSITNCEDRQNMILALAGAGIKVKLKDELDTEFAPIRHTYWVIFELPENNIKGL